jgi:type I restriction enzyme S subunit
MAHAIYREWFVNFRFPGHENVKIVESELGLIPEGWEVKQIGDVTAYLNRGVAPKYDETSDSIVINQKCVRDGMIDIRRARRHTTRVIQEKLLQFGDVLINSTGVGTLGRVAQVYDHIVDCTVDTHVTIVRPSDCLSLDYFGFYLMGMQAEFDRMGAGTTNQTELSRSSISCCSITLPPKKLQECFSALTSPIRKLSIMLQKQNDNLSRTRDLLLPKLVSGEVGVSEIDIDFGESD